MRSGGGNLKNLDGGISPSVKMGIDGLKECFIFMETPIAVQCETLLSTVFGHFKYYNYVNA